MQIVIEIPKAVLFDTKYTVEQATNFSKKEFLEEVKDRKQSLTNLLKKGMKQNGFYVSSAVERMVLEQASEQRQKKFD